MIFLSRFYLKSLLDIFILNSILVPMILTPMSADQPMVAKRLADELGLGIRFDKNSLKSAQIRNAAHKILSDNSYLIRSKRYSDISKCYNGVENIKSEIIELVQKKNI